MSTISISVEQAQILFAIVQDTINRFMSIPQVTPEIQDAAKAMAAAIAAVPVADPVAEPVAEPAQVAEEPVQAE